MIKRPLLIRGFGIYCQNKLEINPKLIEVLICKKDEEYTSLGNFELSLSSGTQVLSTEEFLFNDVIYIKFIIKASFGGSRTYISNIYLYEHLPGNESALPFNEYNKDKDKDKIFYNSLHSRNSEILLSDSDLTEKKNSNKNFIKFNLNSNEKSNIFKIKRKNEEKDESKGIIMTSQSISNHKNFNHNYLRESYDKDNIIKEEQNPLFSSTNENLYYNNSNNRIIIEQLSNFESNINELLNKFDNRISNLENDLKDIKININKILENLNLIIPNSQRDIIDECNKLIESKIHSSKNNYNLNTVNTINTNNFSQEEYIPSNHSNSTKNKEFIKSSNGKMIKLEDLLDNRLDEKLNNFSMKLEKKIYQKLLKPSLQNLEDILQSSLNDVKKQLKNSQQKKEKKKLKKKSHKYMKTDINYNYNISSFREKEMKLNELISKLENKLNMHHYNTDGDININIKNYFKRSMSKK